MTVTNALLMRKDFIKLILLRASNIQKTTDDINCICIVVVEHNLVEPYNTNQD